MVGELAKAESLVEARARRWREQKAHTDEEQLKKHYGEAIEAFVETADEQRFAAALRLSMDIGTPEDHTVMEAIRALFPAKAAQFVELRSRDDPPPPPPAWCRRWRSLAAPLLIGVGVLLLILLGLPDERSLTFDLLPSWAVLAGMGLLTGALVVASLPLIRRPQYRGVVRDLVGPDFLLTGAQRAILLDEIDGRRPATRELVPLTRRMAAGMVRVGGRSWLSALVTLWTGFEVLVADHHAVYRQAFFAALLVASSVSALTDAKDAWAGGRFLRRIGAHQVEKARNELPARI